MCEGLTLASVILTEIFPDGLSKATDGAYDLVGIGIENNYLELYVTQTKTAFIAVTDFLRFDLNDPGFVESVKKAFQQSKKLRSPPIFSV